MKRRFLLLALLGVLAGCPDSGKTPSRSVTIYSAADREISEELLSAFTKETGIHAEAKWDTETNKTVSLGQAVAAEKDRPRADVFWDNEPLQVMWLSEIGALAPLPADILARAGSVPRGSKGDWLGFSGRVRILLVNTAVLSSDKWPHSYRDLTDPKYRGRVAIANPLFGSTTSHVSALFAKLGEKEARAWLQGLRENEVAVCGGNADVQRRVASGEVFFGLTDTDDAHNAIADGKPVAVVFPDQEPGGLGALVMPNALAIIANAPHPDEAKKLVDWLASTRAEVVLAKGVGQQIPLLPGGDSGRPSWIPTDLKTMDVRWEDVHRSVATARVAVQEILLREK